MASIRQLQAVQSRRFAGADRNEKADIKEDASRKVKRAIVAGTLSKPLICDDCGDADWIRMRGQRVRIDAHHPDYGRPLDVEWLCTICHGEADKLRRQAEKSPEWGHYIPDSQYLAPIKTA